MAHRRLPGHHRHHAHPAELLVETDHKLPAGFPFKYHPSQQEAIETLIFVWEFEKVRTRKALLARSAQDARDLRLPPYDDFARTSIKMTTGSGETKVMALAVAWEFLNAAREADEIAEDYAKTFLILAPDQGMAVALMCNVSNAPVQALAGEILDLVSEK